MVYVTGDMHGDITRLSAPALRRLRRGDTLLVCGDFGFIWDGGAAEQKLLKKIGKGKYTVAFIDGRHENFDLLAQYPTVDWNGGRAQQINEHLYHLLRGEIYVIEDKTYFTFGGGESDDRDFRQPGVSWWAAESPSDEEMHHAIDNLAAHGNRVDYILTHVPTSKYTVLLDPRTATDGVSVFLEALESRVTCTRWFFGSLHRDKAISSQRQALFRDVVPVEPPADSGRRKKKF